MYFRINNLFIMNKIIGIIGILMMLVLQSCLPTSDFELNCEVPGLKTDKLLVVFDDPKSKVDSMFLRDTRFFYTFAPDTLTMMRIVAPDGKSIPVFANKGWSVEISGSFSQPKIKGKGANHDYQEFLDIKAKTPEAELPQAVLAFCRKHTNSYASAYVIYNYLIDVPNPDFKLIEEAMQPLNGFVKDTRILNGIAPKLRRDTNERTNYVHYYTARNRKGRYISLSGLKADYILVNLWASWDKQSVLHRDSLYEVAKKYHKKKFKVFNVSLDYDSKAWNSACREETDWWYEICDFKGWENPLVEQQHIDVIPSNILVDKQRNIHGSNVYGSELTNLIEKLIKEQKKK